MKKEIFEKSIKTVFISLKLSTDGSTIKISHNHKTTEKDHEERYYSNGQLKVKKFYKNGNLTRPKLYDKDGRFVK